MLSQDLVLCFKQTSQCSHQDAAFTGKIGINFFFEISFKEITGTYADPQGNHFLFGFTGGILENGVAGV